jgi:uncharacterized tellurite resistance protein B-like protein
MTSSRENALDALRLGLGTGESHAERESLSRYFIRTPVFTEMLEDRIDLVIASRGLGKSAIYEMLLWEAEKSGTVAIPGFKVERGLEKALVEFFGGDRSHLDGVVMWQCYFFAQIYEQLRARSPHDPAVASLQRLYSKMMGVLGVEERPQLQLLNRIVKAALLNVQKGRIDQIEDDLTHLTTLMFEAVQDYTNTNNTNIVLGFDRLDEVFGSSFRAEASTMSSLIRAATEVNQEAIDNRISLRVKLFLRSDLITWLRQGGFPKQPRSTLPAHKLTWDRERLAEVVWKRVDTSGALTFTSNEEYDLIARERTYSGKLGVLFEPVVNDQLRDHYLLRVEDIDQVTPWNWVSVVTRDATGIYNPRFIITLLREATIEALDDVRLNIGSKRTLPLLTNKHLHQGRVRCSYHAFEERADNYPVIREVLERVSLSRNMPVDEWKARVGRALPYESPENVTNRVVHSGVARVHGGSIEIGSVFWPEMRLEE